MLSIYCKMPPLSFHADKWFEMLRFVKIDVEEEGKDRTKGD